MVVLSFLITKTISEAVSPLLSHYDVQIGGESIRILKLKIFSARVVQSTFLYWPKTFARMTFAMLIEALGLGILPPRGWTEMERGCL